MVGCAQSVVGKKSFFQFEDEQKREMSDSSLLYLCDKEEVRQEVDNNTSDLSKILQG